ncbi:NTP transferase domain-containing protein [Nocardioides sp. dk4132]|uniref:nucleotidyltransferase family protein n=1 Tax=unclassified Nocardioides TaxID=2615069 RepID=UPI001295E400|nr:MULTISPECIES: nucleotidyltransferase family protein [unclassified Nocardioides]MQW74618.1 NTP transferase domain-containing protein [Nocardioides sp. dk4132]QGA06532.1 NTP transferase domain-containing protein [Nocardioides sp. dk884]
MRVHGLLLAAGAGRRMGMPKALVRHPDGEPWVVRAVDLLRAGGCAEVTVVLGAGAAEARELLAGTAAEVVVAPDWADGMAASLRAGLRALEPGPAEAALVSLVDLPDLTADVVRRVAAGAQDAGEAALVRATYDSRPGHPVLIGRGHWVGVLAEATGDAGARGYLAEHGARGVECGDLATGRDVDRPQ